MGYKCCVINCRTGYALPGSRSKNAPTSLSKIQNQCLYFHSQLTLRGWKSGFAPSELTRLVRMVNENLSFPRNNCVCWRFYLYAKRYKFYKTTSKVNSKIEEENIKTNCCTTISAQLSTLLIKYERIKPPCRRTSATAEARLKGEAKRLSDSHKNDPTWVCQINQRASRKVQICYFTWRIPSNKFYWLPSLCIHSDCFQFCRSSSNWMCRSHFARFIGWNVRIGNEKLSEQFFHHVLGPSRRLSSTSELYVICWLLQNLIVASIS